MTTKIIRGAEVSRPVPDALTSTVLDHATVTELASFGLRNNDGIYPSYNALDTAVPTEFCPDPPSQKTFSSANWTVGHEFAVYGGAKCLAVGLDVADMIDEIRRVFVANEGKGVEQGVVAVLTNSGSTVVDLTAPAGMSLLQGLAALVGYAAQHYAGQPTIHIPRAAATILFGLGALTENDGKFYTKTGAKVAAGGGYDTGSYVAGADGTMDMYVTGEVSVERSGTVEINSYVIPGDGSNEKGLPDNTVLGLVERLYRVTLDNIDGTAVAAKVTGKAW